MGQRGRNWARKLQQAVFFKGSREKSRVNTPLGPGYPRTIMALLSDVHGLGLIQNSIPLPVVRHYCILFKLTVNPNPALLFQAPCNCYHWHEVLWQSIVVLTSEYTGCDQRNKAIFPSRQPRQQSLGSRSQHVSSVMKSSPYAGRNAPVSDKLREARVTACNHCFLEPHVC